MTMHRKSAEVETKEVPEHELAILLGLDARTLTAARSELLEYETHWRVHNRTVLYSEAGIEVLKKSLGLEFAAGGPISAADDPTPPPMPETAACDPTRTRSASLVVFGCCRNPTWVEAWTKDDRKVLCRVKNNRGMWRGQNLHDCIEKDDGRFEYHGRCPASRGGR